MKHALFFTLVFACGMLSAANVHWNETHMYEMFENGYCIAYPYMTMSGTVTGDTIVLWADSCDYMELSSSWVLTDFGEEISVDKLQHSAQYFYSADFNESAEPGPVLTDYSISLDRGEQLYLAVISRTYSDPEHYDVAWVELYYSTEGVLSVDSSAIDYDGGSLIVGVGPTPEPSSALLMIFGLGFLALRRRCREQLPR